VLYARDYASVPIWGTVGSLPMLQLPGVCWWCPSDRLRVAAEQGSSYTYLALLYMGPDADIAFPQTLNPRLALKLYEDNPQLPLLRDCEDRHPHRNVAFWDGVARRWWD
jgi:prepilin-type processing-associated H-X9-DG protein